MSKICIILPALNEEITVKKVIESFHTFNPYDIWVVDNNSSDNTKIIAEDTINKLKNGGGVLFVESVGKGNALRKAFNTLDYDIYVMCDADFTYPSDMVDKLIAPIIENNADLVIGSRRNSYKKINNRNFHNFGNKLVVFIINKLFNSNLTDVMSGYRALSKSFVRNYPLMVNSFEIETDMSIFALDNNYQVNEIMVEYRNRPNGSISKLNTFKDGVLVLITIFNLFRLNKPLIFFSILALIFFIVGLVPGIVVINEYIQTQYITRIPLAILVSMLFLCSFIFFIAGLILDSIHYHHKISRKVKNIG